MSNGILGNRKIMKQLQPVLKKKNAGLKFLLFLLKGKRKKERKNNNNLLHNLTIVNFSVLLLRHDYKFITYKFAYLLLV